MFAVMEAPAVTPSSLQTSFASFADKGVVICGGFAEIVNDQTSQIQKRSIGRVLAPRIARNPIATGIARNRSDTDLDPMPDVFKLVPDGAAASTGYHDAGVDPTLNNARFTTAMTFVGLQGFYPTGVGFTMAASGSDYQLLPYLRIILAGAQVWYLFGLKNLVKRVRADKKTGKIKESFAQAIENSGQDALRAVLGDNIEDCKVTINRIDSEIGLADSLQAAA